MSTILLIGKNGQLGSRLLSVLSGVGTVTGVGKEDVDLAQPDQLRGMVRALAPEIIVNAAAYTAVDRAQSERELAFAVNGAAPGILAEESERIGALLVHYSTDYVFEGTKENPYTEDDDCHPVNVYGMSKLAGERAIQARCKSHLILRTSWLYDTHGSNFLLTLLRLAAVQDTVRVVTDQIGSPTWAKVLALLTTQLLAQPRSRTEPGIYHLSALGEASRYAFAREIVALAKERWRSARKWAEIIPIQSSEYPTAASRPLRCGMSKQRIQEVFDISISTWQEQLKGCLEELDSSGTLAWR